MTMSLLGSKKRPSTRRLAPSGFRIIHPAYWHSVEEEGRPYRWPGYRLGLA